MKKFNALIAAGTVMFALAGCSDDSDDHDAGETRTAANGDEFNDADVEFATAMIPHHAQALQMTDLTLGRDLSPELRQLAEDIQMAQTPEIEQMTDWLTAWDEPIPETVRDHAHGDDMGEMGDLDSGMPGMMSAEQMAELEAAQGQQFEDLWLEMMIEHHEGAIEMAQTEQDDGVFEPATELAESIETSQQAEIDHMEELLAS